MPSECKFTLNSTEELYYAGKDAIEGVVTLKTTTSKNVKQIKIRFKGVTKCALDHPLTGYVYPAGDDNVDKDAGPSSAEPAQHKSKEKLIKIENVVHKKGVLPPGTYTWPFCFFVDEECPTSMEGKWGHIRYELALKIYNKTKYKNIFLKPVTVVKTDDLNLRPECKQPLESSPCPVSFCGLRKSDTHFNFKTRYGGYAPGQWLEYTLDVFEKTVKRYKIKFIKKTEYKAANPTKVTEVEETIFYYKDEPSVILPLQTLKSAFIVPCTPPTTETKYISVKYFLLLQSKVPCCSSKLNAKLEVRIGTVPLRESLSPQQEKDLVKGPPNNFTIKPGSLEMPFPIYSSFCDEDTTEINRVDGFTPVYPMYRTEAKYRQKI